MKNSHYQGGKHSQYVRLGKFANTDSGYFSLFLSSFFMLQRSEYVNANRNEMEVVVFEADSLDDLRQTHSRYFIKEAKKEGMKAGPFIAIGLVALATYLLTKK